MTWGIILRGAVDEPPKRHDPITMNEERRERQQSRENCLVIPKLGNVSVDGVSLI